jgi:hypothetical protein
MFRRDLDGIDRTAQSAQVADLTVLLVRDERLAGFRIESQHVRRANTDAVTAAHAAVDRKYRHMHFLQLP